MALSHRRSAPARAGAQRRRARAATPASACGCQSARFQAEPAIDEIRTLRKLALDRLAALLLGQLAALGQLRLALDHAEPFAAAGIGAVAGVVGDIELLVDGVEPGVGARLRARRVQDGRRGGEPAHDGEKGDDSENFLHGVLLKKQWLRRSARRSNAFVAAAPLERRRRTRDDPRRPATTRDDTRRHATTRDDTRRHATTRDDTRRHATTRVKGIAIRRRSSMRARGEAGGIVSRAARSLRAHRSFAYTPPTRALAGHGGAPHARPASGRTAASRQQDVPE
ncbi:hypothetical protein [Burkholderia pseudomallei]|nr:hypothetical protein [Burkholderia pseudomallei]KGW36245.1 gethr pentapeptide repeat (5 copies) family protein [Burkholderia pseudomallei MSHR3016]